MQKQLDEMNDRLNELENRVYTNETNLKECRDITDTNKLDIEDILSRLHDMNDKLSSLESLEDLLNRLKKLEEEMKSKLDQHDFNNEIALIRSMIGNIDHDDKTPKINISAPIIKSNNNNGFSSTEMSFLRSMMEKFP